MDKVLVHIDKDEWWPVYAIQETDSQHPGNLELIDSDYKKIMRIQNEFRRLQEQLKELYG